MRNFDRGNRSGGGRGFERRGFSGRGSSGPAQMHQATCDKCAVNCEVPFRPTNGRPIYCSNCFSAKGGPASGWENRSSDRPRFEDRQMFDATCDNCHNSCKVPFRPSGDKPIYCSNCFENKREGGNKGSDQFEQINNKLDKILSMLTPVTPEPVVSEEKVKVAKKKPSKK